MESLISRFDQAINGQKKPVLIFDIDSTIFNVSPRNQDIFDLFCSIHKAKNPILLKISSSYQLKYTDWGLNPYLNMIPNNDSLKKEAHSFWKNHFFSGTFLFSDKPYKGIIPLIKLLYSKNSLILYLTGRDDHRMRKATLLQLRHWGLPLDTEKNLITKPHKKMNDGEYKNKALLRIFKIYFKHSIFFFDNEPSVLKHCLFPELNNYTPIFINSTHSARSKPEPNWPYLNILEYDKFLSAIEKKIL